MTAPIYATCPATVVTYKDGTSDLRARACGGPLFLVTDTNRDLLADGTTEPPDPQQSTWSIQCADGHTVATPDWPEDRPLPSTTSALALALDHAGRADRPDDPGDPPADLIEHAERWLAGDRRATPPLIAGLLDLVKAGRA